MQSFGEKMFKTLTVIIVMAFGLGMPAIAETPKVVTDIKPVHSLVAMVMDGVGASDLIIETGATPHDFSLRPSQARMLQDADVVFWIGEDLTPWLVHPIETLAPKAQSVELLHSVNAIVLDTQGTDGHNHGDHDPHAWLDPENAKVWLEVIAAELAKLDPKNAGTYQANVLQGRAIIDAASLEVSDTLEGIESKNLIVYHDAYRYFINRFGLSVVGAIALSDATAPTAARISDIIQVIKEQNVVCIFSEPQFNSGLVATVTAGSSVKHATLDPLGFHLTSGVGFYPALLKDMALKIKNCVQL